MPETEEEHVQRVMNYMNVRTVVISTGTDSAERIYVDGKLVYGGGDATEATRYLPDGLEQHVICNLDDSEDAEWDCTSYDVGGASPEYIMEEDTI